MIILNTEASLWPLNYIRQYAITLNQYDYLVQNNPAQQQLCNELAALSSGLMLQTPYYRE